MEGKRFAGFDIEAELGSGGMGTVYRGRVAEEMPGLALGDMVALKIINPALLGGRSLLRRFLREGEVGRRVNHRNVVRTLHMGEGEFSGRAVHFLVMEFVEGQTLRKLLDDGGVLPEALLREVARQIVTGLCAIHDAGIIHRDLKPENVLIDEEHQVRIMDLGVARLVEQSVTLTQEGQFTGSLIYAAPEQILGEDVTPVADLYALGVLLYELAAGENPFRRDDTSSVVGAQLTFVPPPVRERNGSISAFLSELISNLLSKDAGARIASSPELLDVLQKGEGSTWWGELGRADLERRPCSPRVPVSRDTELLGRSDECAALLDCWNQAVEEAGRVAFLVGEAGIGKTRVVDAVIREIEGHEAHVLYGSYPPSGGIGGLTEAIVGHFGRPGLEDALRPYLEAVPGLVAAFAAMVVHKTPPAGSQHLDEEAVHTVFCHLMQGLAKERPLLWVVEDLHFADSDSRRFMASMARALPGHRVLLLLTARPGLPEEEMQAFSRLERYRRIALSRLGAREVIELLRAAFRSEKLAERLGGKIALKSDGIPFFIFEMIRDLREKGHIAALPDGTCVETQVVEEIEVPSAVRDLVQARIRDLGREERAVLDVGAVQGFEFDPYLVAEVLGLQKIPTLQILAGTERSTRLVHGEADHFRFDHHQIQEVLLEDLPPQLRAEYHTALGLAYADRSRVDHLNPGSSPGEDALFLTGHFLRGSDPALGVPHLGQALSHLDGLCRSVAALDLANRALDAVGMLQGVERARVLLLKARQLAVLGRSEEEGIAVLEAVGLLENTDDLELRCSAHLALGSHRLRLSRYSEAEALFQGMSALAEAAGIRDQYAAALGALGVVTLYQGRSDEATRFLEESIRISRETGARGYEARAIVNLGNVRFGQGRHEEARALYERQIELADRQEDRPSMVMATGNVGGTWEAQGHTAQALGCYHGQLDLSRELGHRHGEAIAEVNLAGLLTVLGDPARARGHAEACRALCMQTGSRRVDGYAMHALALLSECAGRQDEALERFEEALELRREIGYLRGVAQTLVPLAGCHQMRGAVEKARQCLEEAVALARDLDLADESVRAAARLATLPGGDAQEALSLLNRLEARVWHGARMEARYLLYLATGDAGFLREARRLLSHLEDHAPEEYRETMTANVPLHRDILAAWEEQQGVN